MLGFHKRLIYKVHNTLYISEIAPAFGWPRIGAYRVGLEPLEVQPTDDAWLQSTIALDLENQDRTTRQQAEKLSKFMREYFKKQNGKPYSE